MSVVATWSGHVAGSEANTESKAMTKEQFNEKWTPESFSGCWLWTGRSCNGRYGREQNQASHRMAWNLYRGDIPAGMRVLHRCDTTFCVNPDHLFLGTLKDNSRDSILKGRNPRAKLTLEQVREIRLSPETSNVLAERYGVCRQKISKIKQNKAWMPLDKTQ